MKQQRWGRIVHLLPILGKQWSDGTALSASSQLALVGYSKMLANELAPFNITVNNVMCGPIETDYLNNFLESKAQEGGRNAADLGRETVADIPMRRLGQREEVGALVTFLASDRATYMTGSSVVIDGGMLQTISS